MESPSGGSRPSHKVGGARHTDSEIRGVCVCVCVCVGGGGWSP